MTAQAIGIDFGGTSIKTGVTQGSQIIQLEEPITTTNFHDANSLIKAIADQITILYEQYPHIKTIGAGIPGFVNANEGLIYELPNVAGWNNIDFTKKLSAITHLPCFIENDANCMTYAEWKYGAGKGKEHLIGITLGTGVGGGIISNNQLIQGSQCSAAEIGQTSIDYKGIDGKYNNTGAIEDYIGNQQISQLAHQAYKNTEDYKQDNNYTPEKLTTLANNGDNIAIQLWQDIAKKLACSIVNMCWLLNPQAVIIGGGISKAGKHLFDPLKHFVYNQLAPPFRDHLEVLPAHFGNHAGIIGAAAYALDKK